MILDALEPLMPYVVSGAVAGIVAVVTSRVHLSYLRRDVDRLRETVHSPTNPRNLVSTVQAHEIRLGVLERVTKLD